MLEARNVSYVVDGATLVDGVSCRFEPGRLNAILGPNGAGKTTLLRMLAGLRPPTRGDVTLAGRALASVPDRELARRRGMLSQHVELAFPIPAEEVVVVGRSPHFARFPTARDLEICREALRLCGVLHKARQAYGSLSGGEQQKVQMARVLSQIWPEDGVGGRLLFLDEPTSRLDIRHQIELLELVRGLLGPEMTVVAVLHDVNLTFQFADSLLFLREGRLVFRTDDPGEVTPEFMSDLYAVTATKTPSSPGGHPLYTFSSRPARRRALVNVE